MERVGRCCLYRRVGGEGMRGSSRAPARAKIVLQVSRNRVNGSESQQKVAAMVLRMRALVMVREQAGLRGWYRVRLGRRPRILARTSWTLLRRDHHNTEYKNAGMLAITCKSEGTLTILSTLLSLK